MELINALPKQITLGNQGESGITTIDVDCTAWLTDFPSGELAVTFIPPDQYQPKLLPNTQAYMLPDGTTLRIIVKRNMTQYSGKGSLVIRLAVGDDVEKRSAVAGTYTAPGHATDADLMPADVEDWATDATQKLAEIMARMGFVPKGDYDAATEYKHGDWVSANGGSYGYIYPTPAAGIAVSDTTHWQQIASIGGQDLVDAAVAARDAAQGYKDAAAASAAQLAAGVFSGVYSRSMNVTKPVVSFICDDGDVNDYTVVWPIFQAKSKPFCVAVVYDWIGTGTKMSTAQLLTLQTAGNEIISHTKTHAMLTNPVTDLDAELVQSKSLLTGLGFEINSIAYPGGAHDSTSDAIARYWYRCGIIASTQNGANTNPSPIDTLNITRISFSLAHQTLGYYTDMVDEAIANDSWLVFMTHPGMDTIWDIGGSVMSTLLSDLLDYIIAQGVDILTVNDAMDIFANKIDAGSVIEGYNFRVGANGEIKSNYLDQMSLDNGYQYLIRDSVDDKTLISGFPLKKVSAVAITANAGATFPGENYGFLETYNLGSFANDTSLSFQIWHPYAGLSSYKREWDMTAGAWLKWRKNSSREYFKQYYYGGSTISANTTLELTVTDDEFIKDATYSISAYTAAADGIMWCMRSDANGSAKIRLANITAGDIPTGAMAFTICMRARIL